MRKVIVAMLLILVCNLSSYASNYSISDWYIQNIKDFWKKNGRYEEKVLSVGYDLLNKNNISKNIVITVRKEGDHINAFANFLDKSVTIEDGIFPYMDSDDELAAILSHEIAHSLDMHTSPGRQIAMMFAPVRYETKADLTAIHLMTKAGYNPLALITVLRKISGEHSDFGSTHPRGSSRLTYVYNHIKKYYPQFLNSPEFKKNKFYISALKIIQNNKQYPYGITTIDVEDIVLKEKQQRDQNNIDL